MVEYTAHNGTVTSSNLVKPCLVVFLSIFVKVEKHFNNFFKSAILKSFCFVGEIFKPKLFVRSSM